MASAGQRLVAGRIPGERIATNVRTSDSSNVTGTETLIDSVTAALVSGRTYRIRWTAALATSSASGDTAFVRLREDNLSGTQLNILRVNLPTSGGTGTRWPAAIEVEYTAVSSGNKTFVGTLIRVSSNGNITVEGGAELPVYLYVDYIRG